MIKLPQTISDLLVGKHCINDTIGQSDSSVYIYEDVVLKVEKIGENSQNELRMLNWLKDKLPVPKVLCVELQNGFQFLLMTRLEGCMACDPSIPQPEKLSLLKEAVELLWKIPISSCPHQNSLSNKLKQASFNVENNLVDINNTEPETWKEFKGPKHLLDWLIENRPEEELVFSHGDFCLENLFFNKGKISGFIDMGQSGVADKWQDLALLWRSLDKNDAIFRELNIEPNYEKLRYFVLLDELF